jgi:uncharacterized membrane protein YeaQ/YmgE (transglycosylase-associated protein family)
MAYCVFGVDADLRSGCRNKYENKMQKILFLIILFTSPSAMASGNPLIVYIVFGVVLAWVAVISLPFLIKSSKKGKFLSVLNTLVGLVFSVFVFNQPYSYKINLEVALIMLIPIFCGIVNIFLLRAFRRV